MKKYLITTLTLALLFSLTGCGKEKVPIQPDENPMQDEIVEEIPDLTPDETPVEEDIKWEIKDVVFDKETKDINLTIVNSGNEVLSFGSKYMIEQMNGYARWEDSLLTENLAFDMMLRSIEPGASELITFSLAELVMDTGSYRIVREYRSGELGYMGSVIFSIDEDYAYDHFETEIIPAE